MKVAADIRAEALAEARRAVCPAAMVAPVPAGYRGASALSGRDGRSVRIAPEIRARLH